MNQVARHDSSCACQHTKTGSLGERIATDLRGTTVAEWIQIALAAGALYLSYRIYREVKR